MKKNYLIICFLFALFLGLGAKDMAVSAATRKVIVEQPTEPGTHLDVGYKNPGSFFPIMIDREAMVWVLHCKSVSRVVAEPRWWRCA